MSALASPRRGVRTAAAVLCLTLLAACSDRAATADDPAGFSGATFADPPAALAPIARWWWPGGAVDDDGLRAALGDIADAGYGRVEVQPLLLGLSEGDVAADARVRTVGDEEFRAHLRTVGEAARALGLGWDLTLGSGWPSGAPEVSDAEAEQQLLLAETAVAVDDPARIALPRPGEPAWVAVTNGIVPALGPFDESLELTAVLLATVAGAPSSVPVLERVVDVTAQVRDGALDVASDDRPCLLLAVWRNRTRHVVLGGAFPGARDDAHVVDHLDPAGVGAVLRLHGDPWLDAAGDAPPATVFVDSLELIGDLPWTGAFAERFARDSGLEVAELLPFLFRADGESSYVELLRGASGPRFVSAAPELGVRAREEYEAVRESLFHDGFVRPLVAWAEARGVALRLQGHGGFGDVLDDDASAHVPESEGLYAGGSFDFLKLASSAAHVSGAPEATSESFVLVNTQGTAPLALDDLWRLAGRAYAAGITRLVHHGVPYPSRRAGGARWYPFQPGDGVVSAGPLPISSEIRPGEPAWDFLPAFNRAQARLTYALTAGTPHADVAWLHDERQDAPGVFVVSGSPEPEAGESQTSLALRRAGYAYDRVSRRALAGSTVSDGALAVGAARYRAVLVGDLDAAEPELVEALFRASANGVAVIVLGALPTRATGLRDAAARDARVRAAGSQLVENATTVATPAQVVQALERRGVVPVAAPVAGDATLSIVVRDLPGGRLLYLFNEGRAAASWRLRLATPGSRVELLDPETGARRELPAADATAGELAIELPAARARILLVHA